jgi:hypothetical protein
MTSGNVLASFTRTMGKQDSLSLSFESLTAALKDILNSLSLSLSLKPLQRLQSAKSYLYLGEGNLDGVNW